MSLMPPTRDLLSYLGRNAQLRSRIAAPANRTLLYACVFFRPVWQEIAAAKQSDPALADKMILHEVLVRLPVLGTPYPNLMSWVQAIERQVPWQPDGFTVWRALSGIFAANAVGSVSFCVGSEVTRDNKVFAATEIAVLTRNPQIDALTRDVLAYFERCVKAGQHNMNFGFIAG